jgi:hypothetical protein
MMEKITVIIKRRCAWCGCDMGIKLAEGIDLKYGDTTDGICDPCYEKTMKEYKENLSGQTQGSAPTVLI